MAAPHYVPGIEFNPAVRKDAYDVMARLVEHYRNKSTDQADEQWREPVRNYRDPELWQREIDAVHGKVPLPLALSCELPEPGTYKSIDVAGTPVLITRDRQGEVHAMINVCRHRGAELVGEGTGRTNRLTCPYHAWSYDLAGCLTGVYGEETFGGVDKRRRWVWCRCPPPSGPASCSSRSTPGPTIDLDDLARAGSDRAPRGHGARLAPTTTPRAGSTARTGRSSSTATSRATTSRPCTARPSSARTSPTWPPSTAGARTSATRSRCGRSRTRPSSPRTHWDPAMCVGAIYWLFPGLAVAGGWRSQVVVSLVLPGTTWDTSRTQQILALRHEPQNDDERKAAEHTRDWFHDVVMDEDYLTGYGVQRGLAALGDKEFVFGRNEPGVQHFHQVLLNWEM